jgi:hypothetical protein
VFAVAAVVVFAPWPLPDAGSVRAAAERALPPLAAAAAGHIGQKTCFACHNQAFPLTALAAARDRGLAIDDNTIPTQAEHIYAFLEENKEKFAAGKGTGGQVDTAGWALYALELAGQPPDDVTAAVAEYLLVRDADRGQWRTTSARPPSEASSFAASYLAVRGLKHWAAPEQKERAAARVEAARKWFESTPAADTEDRVFRLRGLAAAGSSADRVRAAADELWRDQRADGGWGQTAAMAADPYATATALAALRDAAGVSAADPGFRRGVGYLVRTQRADGTWFVKSRSKPFQPYYESGFPYGKDQFISVTASGWAAAVLVAAGD